MPELRKDPVIGRWVIIATERAKRPSAYMVEPEPKVKHGFCPFCLGNEQHTPPEALSYRSPGTLRDSPGWWVRVVPNKFPALQVEGPESRAGEGMYDKMNGIGAHEVIIETTEHELDLTDLPVKQTQEVIWAYRDRMVELRKNTRLRFAMISRTTGARRALRWIIRIRRLLPCRLCPSAFRRNWTVRAYTIITKSAASFAT